jgi:hypothetical protein
MTRESALRLARKAYVEGAIDVEWFERRVGEILDPEWHPMKTVDDILKEVYIEQNARGQLRSGRTAQLRRLLD